MANFIQKFADARDYEGAEHQYPNISLVEGEGLIWTAEEPEPDVLLNGSKIKWNVTDGVDRTSVDYPSISVNDAQTLINALNNDKDYTVTATGSYNYDDGKDGVSIENGEVTWELDNSGSPIFSILDPNNTKTSYSMCIIELTKEGEVQIFVAKYGGTATWEINYTITPNGGK